VWHRPVIFVLFLMLTLYIKAKYLIKVHTTTVNNKAWHSALIVSYLFHADLRVRPLTYVKR